MTDKIILELTLDELKLIDKYVELNDETKSVFDKIKVAYPQTKSPVEECYKDWWGQYPELETDSKYDDTRWAGFQAGYEFAYQEKVSETAQERGERVHKEMEETIKIHDGYGVVDYQPTPQTPEQVADGLKQAFREAVKQGIIPEVDKVSDVFMNEMVEKLKGQTLYDVIADWWDEIFTNGNPSGQNIESLVEQIEKWLPKEQSAEGSQNAYVECTVEGFNDCLNTIKRKLR